MPEFQPRKKNLLLSMKYWLVNRDPYKGLLLSLYINIIIIIIIIIIPI